jgi:MFS transporter, PHS family, inorganic phosphate transporter
MLGCKRIYVVEVLVLAAGAIACAFSPNIWWLIGFRFILGIGGDYPVSATIMSEYAGKAHRGMLVSLVFAMQAAGLIVGPLLAAALLSTNLSHDIIWRILVAFGALPALAVYWSRRHLKETPRFLKAAGHEEDEYGKLKPSGHYDKKTHSVSFCDGFHRLIDKKMILSRLIGASAAWFLMDFAYYGNTVSSPLVLSALNGDHTILQKTLTQLGIFAAPRLRCRSTHHGQARTKNHPDPRFRHDGHHLWPSRRNPEHRKTGLSLPHHLRPQLLLH